MDMQVIIAQPGQPPQLTALSPPLVCSGEVVIDVRAALVPAQPPHESRPPHVPGPVGAGVVAASAYGFQHGDRVAFTAHMRCKLCPGCKARPQRPCARMKSIGVVRQGALSTRIHVPKTNVVHLPDGLDHADAVAALADYPQALRCLRDGGGVQPDDNVWLEGAETSVGQAVAHLVEQFGGVVVGPTTMCQPEIAGPDEIALAVLAGPVAHASGFHAALERVVDTGVVIAAPDALDTPVSVPPHFLARPGSKLITAHLPSRKDAEAVITWLSNTAFRPESRSLALADVPQFWAEMPHAASAGPPVVAVVGSA